LPDSLHRKVKELAEQDDISINQFIATAVAEKMAALLTLDYLAERAQRGSRAAFDRVLAKIPRRPPLPGDELPEAVEPNRRLQPTKARKGAVPKRGSRSRLRS
jgi:HicB family